MNLFLKKKDCVKKTNSLPRETNEAENTPSRTNKAAQGHGVTHPSSNRAQ